MFYKQKDRFSIRKFKVGVGSVFLGSFLIMPPQVLANTLDTVKSALVTEVVSETSAGSFKKEVVEMSSDVKLYDSQTSEIKPVVSEKVEKEKTITLEDFKRMTPKEIKACTIEDFEQLNLTDEIVASLSLEQQKSLSLSKNFQDYNRKNLSLIERTNFRNGGPISGLIGGYGWNSKEGNDGNIAINAAKFEVLSFNPSSHTINVRVVFNSHHDRWKEPFYYVSIPKEVTRITSINFGTESNFTGWVDGNIIGDWVRGARVGDEKGGTRTYTPRIGNSIGGRIDSFDERWRDVIGWHVNDGNLKGDVKDMYDSIRARTGAIFSFEVAEGNKEYYLYYTATVDNSVRSIDDLAFVAGMKSKQPVSNNYARAWFKPVVRTTNPQPDSSNSAPTERTTTGTPKDVIMWKDTPTDKDIVITTPTGNVPKIYIAENDIGTKNHEQAFYSGNTRLIEELNSAKEFVLKEGSVLTSSSKNTFDNYTKVIKITNGRIESGTGLDVSKPFRLRTVYAPENITLNIGKESTNKVEFEEMILGYIKAPTDKFDKTNDISFTVEEIRNSQGESVETISKIKGKGNTIRILATINNESDDFNSGVSKTITVTLNLLDKEAAVSALAQQQEKANRTIDDNNNLSQEEKTKAKGKITKAIEVASRVIGNATDDNAINNAKNSGLEAIELEKTRAEAIGAINTAKDARDTQLDANNDLTPAERQAAKQKAQEAADAAKGEIDKATNTAAIESAKEAGETAISSSPVVSAKADAKKAIDEAKAEKARDIDNSSLKDKEAAKAELEKAAEAAKAAIDQADEAGLEKAKADGVASLDLPKAKAEAKEAIDTAKDARDTQLDANNDLTPAERQAAKQKAQEAADAAKGEIDKATNTAAIESAKEAG
ncbi:DUF1542 domain-containing protein, partial [Granulicatella sp. zg-84]|uniref:DUF1542 domain-containing protein n=1 Tax=Granulicatella sp. zg-84 TaxID=2678503 RepID=UPI0013C28B3A